MVKEGLATDIQERSRAWEDAPKIYIQILSAVHAWILDNDIDKWAYLFRATLMFQMCCDYENPEDMDFVTPELFVIDITSVMETFEEGRTLQGFNEMGIVGQMTTLAGQSMKDMYDED